MIFMSFLQWEWYAKLFKNEIRFCYLKGTTCLSLKKTNQTRKQNNNKTPSLSESTGTLLGFFWVKQSVLVLDMICSRNKTFSQVPDDECWPVNPFPRSQCWLGAELFAVPQHSWSLVWSAVLNTSYLQTPIHKLDTSQPSVAFLRPALQHLYPRHKSPKEISSLAEPECKRAPLTQRQQQQQQQTSGCSLGLRFVLCRLVQHHAALGAARASGSW